MKWGDELCGEIVTPESWKGGIVAGLEPDGASPWRIAHYQNRGDVIQAGLDTPIFPPRGWAGKTDVELCRGVFGSDSYAEIARDVTLYTFDMDIKNSTAAQILFVPKLKVNVSTWTRTLEETAALILALQNAQVLAARLQEPA